ncbi:8202_t:CDS:2 [Paraglomus occultum]|uniref:8202_t:CDS:1 n=1 Tax=Paraglomus occultum TaxID=144539 RepID=A0A9N9CI81_9GLOM|nr:8202_t:CDS:2 [Paraglomus occultum]
MTYTDRAIAEIWIWAWFIQRIWATDRFESLRLQHLKRLELKSMIACCIIITLPLQIAYDISVVILRYKEPYIAVKFDGLDWKQINVSSSPNEDYQVMDRPVDTWSNTNKRIWTAMQVLLCFCFSAQTGALYLVQAFWSHLASQWGNAPFVGSLELKIYFVWVVLSAVTLPASLLISEHYRPTLSETVPEFFFSIQLTVLFMIALRNDRKMRRLFAVVRVNPTIRETIFQLTYFIEMNKYLMLGIAALCVSMILFCLNMFIRGLRFTTMIFWPDLLMAIFNFGVFLLWVLMIMIIYPRYYITGLVDNNTLSTRALSRLSTSVDRKTREKPSANDRVTVKQPVDRNTRQQPSVNNQKSIDRTHQRCNFSPDSHLSTVAVACRTSRGDRTSVNRATRSDLRTVFEG